MAKLSVFVSYDHSEDAHYKRLLEAWNAHPDFDFEFDNRSITVAIDSDDAAVVKTAITKKLKTATHLLVIVGEKSHESKWMDWEISRSKESDVNLKITAVKINSTYKSPSSLLNCGTSWATSFKEDLIVQALNEATNK